MRLRLCEVVFARTSIRSFFLGGGEAISPGLSLIPYRRAADYERIYRGRGMSRQESELREQPGPVQSRLVGRAEIVSLVAVELRKAGRIFASRFKFGQPSQTSWN